MTYRHNLSSAQKERGRSHSAMIRSAYKNAFLLEVSRHIVELAKRGELRTTLKERADQLNERGVRTTNGKKLDPQKLSPAMMALGADANTMKRLLHKATDAADLFDVDDDIMLEQLWLEWLYYHTLLMFAGGSNMTGNNISQFIFKPVHPVDWEHPRKRDVRVNIWWYGRKPVLPPQARLVFALFGMFDPEKIFDKKWSEMLAT